MYQRKIIKELSFGKVLSALEISTLVKRSLPLITKILNDLVAKGVLKECGFASSTGGRRPLMYSLAPGQMYAIAVAMDQLVTKIGLIDIENHDIIDLKRFDLTLQNNPRAKESLLEHIDDFISEIATLKDKIIGIGIGMPGFVDVEKGINHTFMLMGDKKMSLQSYFEESLQLPVFIDNDSSLIALTELKLGAAREKKNSMVINVGWGVGLGLILNGELFRGTKGFAGEFSHIPLFENNLLCSCGKSGCLETEASMLVILQKFRSALAEGRVSAIREISEDIEMATSNVIGAALAGDQLAVELISDTAYNIGRGIAILIHILNPEQIIISGRGSMAGNMLLAPIYHAVNKYCIPRLAACTEIMVSSFGLNAELVGAAALVIENYDKKRFGPFQLEEESSHLTL